MILHLTATYLHGGKRGMMMKSEITEIMRKMVQLVQSKWRILQRSGAVSTWSSQFQSVEFPF